eukprot:Sro133_g062960.1 rRNA Methylase (391) ;mRNA; r:36873-38045
MDATATTTETNTSTNITIGTNSDDTQTNNIANDLLGFVTSRSRQTILEKQGFSEEETESISADALDALLSLPTAAETNNANSTDTQRSTKQEVANELLGSITNRAKRTFSTTSNRQKNPDKTKQESSTNAQTTTTVAPPQEPQFTPTDLRYNQNPAISLTALAHWLWSSVLRPHDDLAIDATCGNGYDAVGMASILFANEDLYLNRDAKLICMDVQEQACHATHDALSKILSSSTMSRRVQILQQSHAPLLPNTDDETREPGLVVYNLGYLPNSDDKAACTKVESTISSIVDALLSIRTGGMVSIMTYPGSNLQEDLAVRTLLEAAVAMTNTQGPSWEEAIVECSDELEALLTTQLQRMEKGPARTFRVAEHKKIGLPKAPILMTATRIK